MPDAGSGALDSICDFRALYIVSLYISYAFPLILFFFTFLYLSPFLLIFSFKNRPAPFSDQMSYKATKPGFSFLSLFCAVVHFFWLVSACFCCVRLRLGLDLFCVKTWKEVVREDCQARKLNKEDAMDRCKWRKMIKEARWSGWVWVGECFFWYRPTRVVPDQRPLNGRCCCCWQSTSDNQSSDVVNARRCMSPYNRTKTNYLGFKIRSSTEVRKQQLHTSHDLNHQIYSHRN